MDHVKPVPLPPRGAQRPAEKVTIPQGLTLKVARDFYLNTVREFQLEPHHMSILRESAFALQRSAQARACVQRDGMCLTDSRNGRTYAHPMIAVDRDAHVLFLRGVRELGLDLAEATPARPPTRSGRAAR